MSYGVKEEATDNKLKQISKRVLSEFKFFSTTTTGKTENVYAIAQSLVETKNWNIKSLKMQKIRDIIQKAAIPELIKYMKSQVDIVRSIAAQVFAESNYSNLMNCIELMLDDNSETLRVSCMETLFHLESLDALEMFKKGLTDQSPKVRMKAVVGLAELARIYKNNEAINLLSSAINDPDGEIREFVIDELGLIGNETSITTLLKALETPLKEEKELISESLNIILSKALS